MGDKVDEKSEEKAVFLPTTAQLDLERRVEEDKMSPKELADKYSSNARDFTGDGNDTSAFVGVNPEYMNYANESDRPYRAGPESAVGQVEDDILSFGAVAEQVRTDGVQTDGGGSLIPLVYPELSGSDFENRKVSTTEADAERNKLDPEKNTSSTGTRKTEPAKKTASSSTPSK